MNGIFNIWGVLLLTLAVVVFFLLIWQHQMIYYPRPYGRSGVAALKEVARISYDTDQGRQVAYYLHTNLDADAELPDNLWVVSGGDASLALDWYDFTSHYPDSQAAFLLLDYPGYGESEGRASPQAIAQSSMRALDTLAEYLKVEPRILAPRISLLGHSLGAAVALKLAIKINPQRIVLVSPFTSMREMAIRVVGWPLNYLMLHNFDNRARLMELLALDLPPRIFILHGEQDEIIPVAMGRELAEISSVITYREIKGGDHNGILLTAEAEIYQAMLEKP
ncbi:MAG: alpha/beta hydrolase [Proteobacteria bacterium]|nr:alpha/beta hydrolase [Pseudomonadota bacterium]MBU1715060.1 alpha/beta hydrolase [Pseudomonadota bacterium]